MKKVELLAPSGDLESLQAAINNGADAVYLGLGDFNARAKSTYFTTENIRENIKLAHIFGVKVYITINTLVTDDEMPRFLDLVKTCVLAKADAFIVQDFGCAYLLKNLFPNIELHASTQMGIHNVDGAKFAKSLGFSRVVLSREATLQDIIQIKKETGLEIEYFVQGALCVAFSGNCYFSALEHNQSGNRGKCLQLCRLPYTAYLDNKNVGSGYLLSARDLCLMPNIEELINAGVDSFKIEGRMKSPSYVYTTTKLYKETRDNYLKTKKIVINKKDIYNLKKIFARPYTKGYLLNANNNDVIFPKSPNHQGVKVGEVVKTSKNLVKIKCSDTISIHDGLRIVNDDFEYGLVLNEFRKNNKQVYKAYKNDCITFRVNKLIPINSRVIRTYASEIEDNISNEIKNKKRRVPISLKIIIQKEKPIKLIITDFKNTITIHGDIPELAQKREIKKEEIREKLEKIKDTIYEYKNLEILLDDNLFVPIKSINFLKKEAIEKLNQKR